MNEAASPLDGLADMLQALVAGGDSIEAAIRRVSGMAVPPETVAAARGHYERRVGRIRELRDPGGLVDEELVKGYWYGGPKDSDLFWPALKAKLAVDLDAGALSSIENASDRILGLMRPPGAADISTRGLVLGYVQSGKTTSFMSVIAKGADVGYRLFIVMSGITDNLRTQTQERLEEMLVGDMVNNWHLLTDLESDFHRTDNAPNLLSAGDQRLLAVVKKNPYRLRRLVRWLDSAGETTLKGCPILIIDDEADQASVDVGRNGRASRINGLITQLVNKPKAAYVAYTATPFANILIDPANADGLYPRDFIVDLPRSPDYFGPERIFGREALEPSEEGTTVTEGLDLIRHIDPLELPMLQPPRGRGAVYGWEPELTESLRTAVMWFFLATSARRVRGTGNRHSTMLVHTSMLAEGHRRLGGPIEQFRRDCLVDLASADHDLWSQFEQLWLEESGRIPPEGDPVVTWAQIAERLVSVLDETRLVIDNYMSTERLFYPRDHQAPRTTAIVIGGNTLSRGLTLEGLVCSFFVRSASAYDTLLQMGRWFGYRRGYPDLVRLWITGDLEGWFFDLATVEQEMRNEIRRFEEGGDLVTPAQFAVKIRDHPAMSITSAAKMRNAQTVEVSFGASRQQTILFNHKDRDWLEQNRRSSAELLTAVAGKAVPGGNRDGRPLFRDVDSADVLGFLAGYQFHERASSMRRDLLEGYIAQQNEQGFLRRWNIVVMEHPDTANGTADLGLGRPVNRIQRARMDIPGIPHANIKALVSTIDRASDLPQPPGELHQMAGGTSDRHLAALREDLLGDTGLLCLYPISRDSQPRPNLRPDGQRRRLGLDAVKDVIGVALFFPAARGQRGGYSYVAVSIPDLADEEPELQDEINAVDDADEAAGKALDDAGPAVL